MMQKGIYSLHPACLWNCKCFAGDLGALRAREEFSVRKKMLLWWGQESWGCTRRFLLLCMGEMALFSKRGTTKFFYAERLSTHESHEEQL